VTASWERAALTGRTPAGVRAISSVGLAVAALLASAGAHAGDGPIEALGNMLNASPTLTIVSGGVLFLTDASMTTVGIVSAVQRRNSERGIYVTELVTAAPQAIGFAIAPFAFDISQWKPEENLLLLLPFQAWSAALATHGSWSLGPSDLAPGARFGVSFLVGMNTAFSATAIGCGAVWGRWAPLEVGIAEMGLTGVETGVAIERAIHDEKHSIEWGLLAGWSTLLVAHGLLSTTYRALEEGRFDREQRYGALQRLQLTPWFSPAEGGAMVGIYGRL
jgi:hypothetical protein